MTDEITPTERIKTALTNLQRASAEASLGVPLEELLDDFRAVARNFLDRADVLARSLPVGARAAYFEGYRDRLETAVGEPAAFAILFQEYFNSALQKLPEELEFNQIVHGVTDVVEQEAQGAVMFTLLIGEIVYCMAGIVQAIELNMDVGD